MRRGGFFPAFAQLAFGSVVSVVISVAASPFVTRLFTPSEFGAYSLIMVGVGIFGPVICMKYDMAIVLSRSDNEAYSLTTLCGLLCLPLSVVIGSAYVAILFRQEYGPSAIVLVCLAMSLLLLLDGLNNVLTAHNNRDGMYGLMSSVSVVRAFVTNVAFVTSGVSRNGFGGLIASQLLGSLAGSAQQSRNVRRSLSLFSGVSRGSLWRASVHYVDQARYNALSTLLSVSVYSAIALFVRFLYSPDMVGFYALSYRVLGIPFGIISANMARVFFEAAAREHRLVGHFRSTFRKTVLMLVATVIPAIAILALVAPPLFSLAFGTVWLPAGSYVRLLAPMFAVKLIVESVTTSFIVAGRQRAQLHFDLALLLGELFVFAAVAYRRLPIEVLLSALSLVYVVVLTAMMIFMLKCSGPGGSRA